ncbi:hypothetical protein N3K66_007447 [Trichothecium roseum]|uniref:Uncharacterized protein n=1 Tax=Trichothecium roseum TaxID=47278 RepID=A0ACC0UU08_9HYPO|nr:hypothetical protein N3K66_007447 [Trichothecium roseum]
MGAEKNDRKRGRTEEEIAADVAAGKFSHDAPTSKKQKTEERRSLFVRSLPPNATSESLADFFSQYFPVKHATVVTDKQTNESKGFGFVTFADTEDASQAKTALDKKVWDGRSIRIEIAEPRHRNTPGEKGPRPAGKPPGRDENIKPPKLIVRNLPWSIKTSEQLGKLFMSYGKIKYADLPTNKGKMKGFGFVTIRGQKNAEKAIEGVNGKEIDGRTLAVDWAVDREAWQEQQGKEEEVDPEDETSDSGSDEEEEDEDENGEKPTASKTNDPGLDADLANFMKNHMQNMEDEDDDDEEDEEGEEDEEEAQEVSTPAKKQSTDNSSTIFIRNLPFTTTDEQLQGFFTRFGAVRYARVVMDKVTEKPAGTGFVCFVKGEDAKSCIKGAPRPAAPTSGANKQSILQDESADPDGKYTLDGRLLSVAQAVNKETATHLADSSLAKRREKDKRKLFLLGEGHIGPDSPIHKLLSEPEIRMRQASAAQRRKLVQGNPTLHVSLVRLALRNIPRNLSSKEFKELARKAIVGFAKDVKEGRRQPLSKEENARDSKEIKDKERERKLKGKGIVRQAKIVFESAQGSKIAEDSGAGKSRGYGFIEYTSHHWALMGLRYLNGLQLPGDGGRKQRLIAEFAIENVQVVQRREAGAARSAQRQKEAADAKSQPKPDTNSNGGRAAEILKTNKDARGKKGKKPKKGKKEKVEVAAAVAEPEVEKDGMKQKLIARKRLVRKKKAKARS